MRFSLHIHSSNINIDGPSPWIAISFLLNFPHVTGHNSNPRFPSVVFLLQYFFFPTFLHLSLKVFIFFDFFFLIFILKLSFVSSQVQLGATVGVTEELDVLMGESVGLDVLTGEVVGFCVGVFEVIQPSDESHVRKYLGPLVTTFCPSSSKMCLASRKNIRSMARRIHPSVHNCGYRPLTPCNIFSIRTPIIILSINSISWATRLFQCGKNNSFLPYHENACLLHQQFFDCSIEEMHQLWIFLHLLNQASQSSKYPHDME